MSKRASKKDENKALLNGQELKNEAPPAEDTDKQVAELVENPDVSLQSRNLLKKLAEEKNQLLAEAKTNVSLGKYQALERALKASQDANAQLRKENVELKKKLEA